MAIPQAAATISGGQGGISAGDIGGSSAENGDFSGGTNILNLGGANQNPFAATILTGLGAPNRSSGINTTALVVSVAAITVAVLLLNRKVKR